MDTMEEFINPIIPITVLSDSRISSLEKLLLLHIISLCKNKGYCWATNSYFMSIHGYSNQTISKSINHLASLNYINLKYEKDSTNNSKLTITLDHVLKNKIQSIKENFNSSIQSNFKQYKKSNINKIYYKDELGNEYWNGQLIKSETPTEEELEELNKLLEEFKKEEE